MRWAGGSRPWTPLSTIGWWRAPAIFPTCWPSPTCNSSSPEDVRHSAGGFRDFTRIGASNAEVWAPILRLNRAALLEALTALESQLDRVRRLIDDDDGRSLVDLLEDSARRRGSISVTDDKTAEMTAEMTADVPVITIDGPVGSGKGTVSTLVAERLGWHLLDSGALYRIVALVALQRGIATSDADALAAAARGLDIRFEGRRVWVEGMERTDDIRTEAVSQGSSQVAALQPVRDAILDVQHAQRRPPGLVADGRDMGTVVFPDARLKVFLDASVEERAERRFRQLTLQGRRANRDAGACRPART